MDIFIVIFAFQRSKRKVANVYLTYLCHTCRTWLSSVQSPRLHCCNIPTPCPALIFMHFCMYTALYRFLRDGVINMRLVRKTEPVLYLSSTLEFLLVPAGKSSHCRGLNHPRHCEYRCEAENQESHLPPVYERDKNRQHHAGHILDYDTKS